jgi:hypothetical protein
VASLCHPFKIPQLTESEDMSHGHKRIPKAIDNIKLGTILESPIHGFGLWANRTIEAGEVLCILDGQLINYDEFDTLTSRRQDLPYIEWNAISGDRILVRMFRTKYSYINHSRTPNCHVLQGEDSFIYVLVLNETIKQGCEITIDYRNEPLPAKYISGHGRTYL